MRVGLIGTGAIAGKHAEAYAELGYEITAVSNRGVEKGRAFASEHGSDLVADWAELVTRTDIDYVDVCTFPDSHLDIVKACAQQGRSVLLQKPMDLNLDNCREMIRLCEEAGVRLGALLNAILNQT